MLGTTITRVLCPTVTCVSIAVLHPHFVSASSLRET